MTETADIVVIGGGIIGCAVVQHLGELLPDGTRVVLCDRGAIAGATSSASQGHLMVTPDDAQEYAFSAGSVRLWRELHQRHGGFELNATGALYLADDGEDLALLPQLQQQFRDHGEPADVLDARALREVEPGLAPDVPGALWYPGDGVVLPMLACGAMLRAAAATLSLSVRPFTEVGGIQRHGGRVTGVTTARGAIAAGAVVIAAGVWTPAVAAFAGLPELPIHPRAGNLAITAHSTSPIRTQLLEVSYLRFAHGATRIDPTGRGGDPGAQAVNMQPQTHGGCLIGSTRQFRGMDRTLNRELLRHSLRRAARYVPSIASAPIVRTWVGLRPYVIDRHPLIGPWPDVAGLWIAAGHEGLGITLAPITGRLLAQQMAGVPTMIDVQPYRPARFAA